MHPDRKIGFAMGILLVGIVGALFFRNEPLMQDEVPTVRREKELNEQLRDREVAVYLDDPAAASDAVMTDDLSEPNWTLHDVLKDLASRNEAVPLPVGRTAGNAGSTPDGRPGGDPAEFRRPPAESIDQEPGTTTGLTAAPSRTLPPLVAPLKADASGSVSDGTEPSTVPLEFDEYVVRYGDTLSHIAERFLGSQSRFQEIYEVNRDRLSAPDRLQVGKAIRIPRH